MATPFTLLDAIGMVGVALMLVAYALTVSGRLDPLRPGALLMNLVGAVAVLVSLTGAFNWSAAVIESAWAVIAAGGLVRWFLKSSRERGAGPSARSGGRPLHPSP